MRGKSSYYLDMNLDLPELLFGIPLHLTLLCISKLYANRSYDEAAGYFSKAGKV